MLPQALPLNSTEQQARQGFRQPWLFSPRADLLGIILPAFAVTALVVLFPHFFSPDFYSQGGSISPWMWLGLVVGVDVAHVYATLFRTYWQPAQFQKNRALFLWIPLGCWLVGSLLYSVNGLLFWRCLAYLAVFHFIRQQYGFMMLYARQEPICFDRWRWLDASAIYLSTLYPLAYWHAHLPRHFSWFVEGDFVSGLSPLLAECLGWLLLLSLAVYGAKEAYFSIQSRQWNWPKNLLLLGTALSWYVGIVVFNGDLAFTATNVISHGIPYMALVWLLERRQSKAIELTEACSGLHGRRLFSVIGLPLFIALLWLIAWLEEGLWDGFIWREHPSFFQPFISLPEVVDPLLLTWLVPFLAIPQATHYVLDGLIWRKKSLSLENTAEPLN